MHETMYHCSMLSFCIFIAVSIAIWVLLSARLARIEAKMDNLSRQVTQRCHRTEERMIFLKFLYVSEEWTESKRAMRAMASRLDNLEANYI
jgi:hypothetical protein